VWKKCRACSLFGCSHACGTDGSWVHTKGMQSLLLSGSGGAHVGTCRGGRKFWGVTGVPSCPSHDACMPSLYGACTAQAAQFQVSHTQSTKPPAAWHDQAFRHAHCPDAHYPDACFPDAFFSPLPARHCRPCIVFTLADAIVFVWSFFDWTSADTVALGWREVDTCLQDKEQSLCAWKALCWTATLMPTHFLST